MKNAKRALVLLIAVPLLGTLVAFSLPEMETPVPDQTDWYRCNFLDGQTCSPSGSFRTCYHIYPTEPDVCYCDAGRWECA